MKKILFAAVMLIFIGTFAYRFYGAGQPVLVESIADVQAREGIPVEVEPVEVKTIEVWRAFSGTVEGITQTPVMSQVVEEVSSVKRALGDRVKAGEVLVQLSRRKSPMGYQQAVAAHDQAERDAQRLGHLFKEGAVSEQQLDGARTQLKIARANRDAAVAHLDILAPIDGVIVRHDTKVGDLAQPGKALMVISDFSDILVKIHVSGNDTRRIKSGQTVRLVQIDGASYKGSVYKMALSADPKSRLVAVDLRFDNTAAMLIPGMLVVAEVLMESARDVPVIARRALHKEGDSEVVWVVGENGVARRQQVEVGLVNDAIVEIRRGLIAGDYVITSGASLLDGERSVHIVSRSQKEN